MKVHELKIILDKFDPSADVEIVDLDMSILVIEEIKLMMVTKAKVKPGGFVELTERARAAAKPICTIVTRRLNHVA